MRQIFILAFTTVFIGPAFAVGSNDDSPPVKTQTSEDCKETEIFDEKTETCVKADKKSFNDDDRYDAVRELAYAEEYERALSIIAVADNPKDPRFLNYQGFIHRKTGKMDRAMVYYEAALRADPDYHLARSYMGQGLYQSGHRKAAQQQLEEIAARGGTDTWAYQALAKVISGIGEARY